MQAPYVVAVRIILAIAVWCIFSLTAQSQQNPERAVIEGLSRAAILPTTSEGNAALAVNYVITGDIQTGNVRQPTLLPFHEQQQQAIRDAFITDGNLANLADGLGSTLGASYVSRAHYIDRTHFSSVSDRVASVISYVCKISSNDSAIAKFLFANGTTDGHTAASIEVLNYFSLEHAKLDVFGVSYQRPAGTAGADIFGNSRPFQTERDVVHFSGPDYFNIPASDIVYTRGPFVDLTNSPSYPSGHTTYGYTGALVLALLVPERYEEMIARAAEYGNDRILIGAHYAMDVIAGRTLAEYDMAHLLANHSTYIEHERDNGASTKDLRGEIIAARTEITHVLQASCGNTIEVCAREDTGRFNNRAANEAFVDSTQTYGLPVIYTKNLYATEDVQELAPEAGYLLTIAFPSLTLQQADQILTKTEGQGGGFLDDGSSFGVYSRLDLFQAAKVAEQTVR